MKVDILTLFPEMFDGVFTSSILGKAQEKGLLQVRTINFRQFSTNKHQTVDDAPYGGGGGMVLQVEPLYRALVSLLGEPPTPPPGTRVILMCPQGEQLTQKMAEELAQSRHLILICGHYEGVDERIRHFLTDEISIGDYILTGGEIPAMVVVDSVARLLPGVLGNPASAQEESFQTGLLEYPHYTRPPEFMGWKVPEVLLSGNHQEIARWRLKESLRRTLERRPELLERRPLTPEEQRLLAEIMRERQEEEAGPR